MEKMNPLHLPKVTFLFGRSCPPDKSMDIRTTIFHNQPNLLSLGAVKSYPLQDWIPQEEDSITWTRENQRYSAFG